MQGSMMLQLVPLTAFIRFFCAGLATLLFAMPPVAWAAEPEPESSDPKALTMIIGYTAGGGVDAAGRLIAQFLPKYLPSKPPVIVRNMPGADGRVALNFFVRQAKPDGLMITTGSGTQLDPMAFRSANAHYDPTKFNFIGGISRGGTFQVISKSGEERINDKDAVPVAVGAVDGTRSGEQMISWGMEFLDWNAKWVVGYRGANETSVALERGEVDLVTTANAFLIKRLLDTGKFKVLTQSGVVVDGKVRRRTDFPDTPVMAELIASKLTDPVARDAFSYLEAMCLVDPWVSLPPNTPPDIVATYREAFHKMLNDPEFLEKGKRISEDIGPMTHKDVALLVKTADERLTPAAEKYIRTLLAKQGIRPKE
jgi:tripartite-type tricarboxylate transporter receptor subunit TctC